MLSRHKDRDEAIASGKAASRTITEEGQSISMITGNVSDDGVATRTIQFLSFGNENEKIAGIRKVVPAIVA